LSSMTTSTMTVVSAGSVNPRHCSGSIRHVHLAVGPDSSTSMIVSFASIPSRFEAPFAAVLVGTSPDQMLDLHLEERENQQTQHSSSPTGYNVTVESKLWANNNNVVDEHGKSDDRTYWSPFYHHVTITDLQPSTTYFYQPLIRPNKQAFNQYNLRHKEEKEKVKWEVALKESVIDESNDDFDEFMEDLDEEQGRRQLFHPPYDGSQKQCPSVDKIRSFRTGPAKDVVGGTSSSLAATFAILGDLGQFEHSEELMTSLLRRGSRTTIDAAVLAGDIAYTGTDHRRWDTFFDLFDDYPFFEKTPVQIVPGNHDIDKLDWSNEIFLAYENRFRMPRVKPPQLGLYDNGQGNGRETMNMDTPPYPLPYEWGNAYYSWHYAGAYFVMINAYASMEPNSTQYKWIEQELAVANSAVQRVAHPWLVVVIHTPIYNTFGLHLKDAQIVAAKQHLEPLFLQHQVNLVFSGHIHAYLRTKHVAMGQVVDIGKNPKNPSEGRGAPMHITVGAGGRKCEAPFRSAQPEDWVAVRDATVYGYGMLRIHNRTTAEWDWIHTGHADDGRDYNQLWKSPTTHLPAGPAIDHVYIQNQYYL
jgi:acid phosphatase type 7